MEYLREKLETKRLWKIHHELAVVEGTYSPELSNPTPLSNYEGGCHSSEEEEDEEEDGDYVRYLGH